MGNDLRIVKAQDLAILSNAAVIAVNQDPLGSSAARRWHYETDDIDEYGKASYQLWSGSLNSTTGGDYNDAVVVLVNSNNSPLTMNATLADIFTDSGGANSDYAQISWEVRDLWADRMSTEEAQAIIDASSASGNYTNGVNATRVGEGRYNATAKSYAEGLADLDPILLGNVTTTVQPMGTITADVDRHGVAMFRLRALPTATLRKRVEL